MPSAIQRPTVCQYDAEQRVSELIFAPMPGLPPEAPRNGRYVMRGGICWPKAMDRASGDLQGFAVMLGQDCRTSRVYVFEEMPFVSIEHVIRDGKLAFEGLCSWLVMVWQAYSADRYGVHQMDETMRQYVMRARQCPMVKPKPRLRYVPWQGDSDVQHLVWQAITEGKLFIRAGGDVQRALEAHRAQVVGAEPSAAVHALQCALMYFMTWPWKERKTEGVAV